MLGQMEWKIIEFTALWCVIPDGKLLFEMSLRVQSFEKSKWGEKNHHGPREKKIKNNRIIVVINYVKFF